MQKQRLELDWIGKDEERRLEPDFRHTDPHCSRVGAGFP